MKKKRIIENNSEIEVPYLPAGNWQVLRPCLVGCKTVRIVPPFADYGNWTNLPGMELEVRIPRPESKGLKPDEVWLLLALQLSVDKTWAEFNSPTTQDMGVVAAKETQFRIRARLEAANSEYQLTLPATD